VLALSASVAVAAEMVHNLADLAASIAVLAGIIHRDPRGRGIKVAHCLVEHEIDVLGTADDIENKGPGNALQEAGVQILLVDEGDVEQVAARCLVLGRVLFSTSDRTDTQI